MGGFLGIFGGRDCASSMKNLWFLTSFLSFKRFDFNEESDMWVWRNSRDDIFPVGSSYHVKVDLTSPSDAHLARENSILLLIWDGWALSKVKIFFGRFCRICSLLWIICSSERSFSTRRVSVVSWVGIC